MRGYSDAELRFLGVIRGLVEKYYNMTYNSFCSSKSKQIIEMLDQMQIEISTNNKDYNNGKEK